MSQRAFQATLARLVIDPRFRSRVVARGEVALGKDLTDIERRRLIAAAAHKGLDITRTLHNAWRLSKILSMLPFTCALLGQGRFVREVSAFWRKRLPRSLHFFEEALAFCDYLDARLRSGLRVTYLEEVVAYERARVELYLSRVTGAPISPRRVEFRHDPQRLIDALAAGRRPRRVAEESYVLEGTLAEDGNIRWRVVEGMRAAEQWDPGGLPSVPDDAAARPRRPVDSATH